MCVMDEVMAILVPFLAFASTYIATKTQNMLMLDSRFKSLDVVKGFVGRAKII
jgi:hypothetical protein